ncbi:MAG: hypothetical protein AAF092_12890 [Pseudomonadota bacterium]
MAWKMFTHALRMLLANLGSAARISVVPLVVVYGSLALFTFGVFSFGEAGADYGAMPAAFGFAFVFAFVTMLAFGFVLAWIAVSWHRFILLEEYPTGWFPKYRGSETWSYIGRFIILGFVLGLIWMVPGAILMGTVMSTLARTGPTVGVFVTLGAMMVVVAPVMTWLMLRFSAILPAAALGKPLGIGESWSQTAPHSGLIFRYGLFYILFGILVQLAATLLLLIPVVGQLLGLFISWFTMLLGLSIVTTVYGVAVEGREPT